jgi:hypothetical protein
MSFTCAALTGRRRELSYEREVDVCGRLDRRGRLRQVGHELACRLRARRERGLMVEGLGI